MLAKEIWKDIRGYENKFLISYFGDIYALPKGQGSRPGICKTDATDGEGYPIVHLLGKTIRVHILVAEHFLEPRPGKEYIVNHRDGNKSNFIASNLEWSTRKDNTLHAVDQGLMPIGSKRKLAKLDEEKVFEIKYKLRFSSQTMAAIGREYGVSAGTIGYIKSGRNWKHVRWPESPQDKKL